MSRRARRTHDQYFKTKVVLEALKERKTLSQLSSEFEIHANQITTWKRQLLDSLPTLFEQGTQRSGHSPSPEVIDTITAPLFQQIGQLKVEVDFLKKKLSKSA